MTMAELKRARELREWHWRRWWESQGLPAPPCPEFVGEQAPPRRWPLPTGWPASPSPRLKKEPEPVAPPDKPTVSLDEKIRQGRRGRPVRGDYLLTDE